MLSKPNERSNRKMRKLMISVLVAACVVGIFGTSLGAFSDTAGTKYSEAATVLSGLGLLKGYEDGTFKPANTITRAEFSAVAVRALGLEAAAAVAGAATKFSDVPATHWAAGYINICSDQGIIKGYADGTFKPEAPVTYAEVLAMIVRMLGYDPSVTGTWPTNYIVKAYDIGLAGGVTFAAGSPATRGDVALFVQKALTLPLMVQVWTGAITSYVVDPATSLLGDKLGYESYTGYVDDCYTLFDTNLAENQVSIDGWYLNIGAGVDFPPGWYGQLVKVWDDGDTIVAAVNKTAAGNIVTGTVNDWDGAIWTVQVGSKVKTYEDPALSTIYARNNIWATEPAVGDSVRLVLEDGLVISAVGWLYDDSVLLTKVDAKYDKLYGFDSVGNTWAEDLTDVDPMLFEKGGKAVELKDLAAGDLLYYVEGSFWGVVCTSKVTGKVESIDSDAGSTTVTIGGEAYAVGDPMTYSEDNNESVLPYGDEDDLMHFDGVTATLYLDGAGDIRHMSADLEEGVATTRAVIKTEFYIVDNPDPEEADVYYVYAFKLDGTTAKLQLNTKTVLDEDNDPETDPLWAVEDILVGDDDVDLEFPVGSLVDYTLKDGIVGTLSLLGSDGDDTFGGADPICDTDYNMVTLDGVGPIRASASTLFIDYANWKIRKWADFKSIDVDGDAVNCAFFLTTGGALKYLLYDALDACDVTYGTKSANAGIVTGRQTTVDGIKVKILLADGKVVSYLVDDTDTALDTCEDANLTGGTDIVQELNTGDYVTFKVSGDVYTEITEPVYDDFLGVAGTIEGSGYVSDFSGEDGTLILCADPEADPVVFTDPGYVLSLDCVVFDVSGTTMKVADYENISDDQIVRVFYDDAFEYIEIILIVD